MVMGRKLDISKGKLHDLISHSQSWYYNRCTTYFKENRYCDLGSESIKLWKENKVPCCCSISITCLPAERECTFLQTITKKWFLTMCHQILPVLVHVINKSYHQFWIYAFVNHLYDQRSNINPLCPLSLSIPRNNFLGLQHRRLVSASKLPISLWPLAGK